MTPTNEVLVETPGRRSVYRFCTAQTDPVTGRRFLTQPSPYPYRVLSDTTLHTVGDGDTLITIAARAYASLPNPTRLWKVIGLFQPEPIHDPTIALDPGRVIHVPSQSTLDEEIFVEARRADYEAGA